MSVTVANVWTKVRALIDEYTEDGTLIADGEVIDLQSKAIVLADMAQKELFRSGNYFKTYEFLAKRPENLLSNGFEVYDFDGTTKYYPNESGVANAKAYYFEADGTGTAYIQELESGSWSTLTTIDISTTNTTSYSGTITASTTGNMIRMVFGGTNHYFYSNMALYELPYSSGNIPYYKPFYKVTMPSDFKSVSQIIKETSTGGYERYASHRWENFKDLYVNYYFTGNIRVQYRPVPTTLTALTDVIEIDDITAEAIPYYVAARLSPFEQSELVGFFENKYEQLKAQSFITQPAPIENIEDIYGGFDCG